MENCH